MKITQNQDTALVAEMRQALKLTGGYCPCALERSEDTKCPCKEFREQTEPGECHCGLYIKSEE